MKRRAELGLTLLEVMAAVALLGILYAYLAKAASQGILTAGDSRWRLEASLMADEEFVALERQILEGVPLDPGSYEEERDLFTIRRRVEAFTLPIALEDLVTDAPVPGSSLLGNGTPQDPGLLRRVVIEVAWFDGVDEQKIERETFAYDRAAAFSLLGAGLGAGEELAP